MSPPAISVMNFPTTVFSMTPVPSPSPPPSLFPGNEPFQPADVDALAAARAAHDPLTIGERKPGLGKAPELPTPPVKRHRLHLPADGAHAEALVLTSIVTEGEWADGGESRKSRTWGKIPHDGEAGGKRGKWARKTPDGLAGEPAADGEMRGRCLERLEAAAGLGFEELRRRHVEDVRELFDRVGFSLGHPSKASTDTEEEIRPQEKSGPSAGDGSSSCVAGLPIRSRVARSGAACVERVDEDGTGEDLREIEGEPARAIVDDGLIELMYHFGRWVGVSLL